MALRIDSAKVRGPREENSEEGINETRTCIYSTQNATLTHRT